MLYGSGQRRGKRRDVYEIEQSPSGGTSGLLEESIQEELIAQEDFDMLNGVAEESYIPDIGIDVTAGADVEAESEVVTVAPKQPVKRGRKRKSDALKPEAREEQEEPRSRNHGEASTETQAIQKQGKKAAAALGVQPRRSKRVSELSLEEPSTMLDGSTPASNQTETPPVARKARGRPKTKAQTKEVPPVVEKSKKQKQKQPDKENEEPVFKKPKAVPKRKRQDTEPPQEVHEGGKLVDACGKPLSKADIDQLSTTSAGSRFGRGRHLSVFRELEPDAVARVGRTGRHRVQPINWWKNEAIAYDPHGSMQAIVKNESKEPETRKRRTESKGKRRALSALQEEEDTELEPWEEEDGVFVGIFRDWDVVEKCPTQELLESGMLTLYSASRCTLLTLVDIAWAPKGIGSRLADTADSSFKFTKLASAGYNSYFSWGFIELQPDQMKRTKNNRRLHMVFHIQSGAVEAKVHESMFTVHRGGVFHVPRGKSSISFSVFPVSHCLNLSMSGRFHVLSYHFLAFSARLTVCTTAVTLCFSPGPTARGYLHSLSFHSVFTLRYVAHSLWATTGASEAVWLHCSCGWCRAPALLTCCVTRGPVGP